MCALVPPVASLSPSVGSRLDRPVGGTRACVLDLVRPQDYDFDVPGGTTCAGWNIWKYGLSEFNQYMEVGIPLFRFGDEQRGFVHVSQNEARVTFHGR